MAKSLHFWKWIQITHTFHWISKRNSHSWTCCTATKCAATEEQLDQLEEDVLDKIRETGGEIKQELKDDLGKAGFSKVKDEIRDKIKAMKSSISEMFGF